MSVKPSQFDALAQMLEVTAARHRVTSQNIANVNTPGYRARMVTFDEALTDALGPAATAEGETPIQVSETPGLKQRADGNNVDIDLELTELNKNALDYRTYTQILASKLSLMRQAITGR